MVGLPQGKDPDEIVGADPEAWPRVVSEAKPIVEFVLDELTREADLEDPKVKADVVRRVLPLIGDVADPVEREAYRQSIARRLKVDERALLEARPAAPPGRRRAAPAAETAAAPRETAAPQFERFCLGLLLRQPGLLYRIDRRFAGLNLERLSPDDFHGTDSQEVFEAVRAALAQDDQEPTTHWGDHLPDSLREHAQALVGDLGDVDPDQPRVQAEAVGHALRLRRRLLESTLMDLRYQLLNAQEEGASPEELRRLIHEVQRSGERTNRIDRALAGEDPRPSDEVGDAWLLA